MVEISKYENIKEIKRRIAALSNSLINLTEILDNKELPDIMKDENERQAWKVIERIKEVIDEYGKN